MAITRTQEARALDADERAFVDRSHHPEVQTLTDAELSELLSRVRERRDRAKDEQRRQRREIRGKSDAKGARPARDDGGTQTKLAVLAMAVRRLNSEFERRRTMRAKVEHVERARAALAMKEAQTSAAPENARRAHEGMREVASRRRQNLMRPMERGRQRKAGAVAQARRDSR